MGEGHLKTLYSGHESQEWSQKQVSKLLQRNGHFLEWSVSKARWNWISEGSKGKNSSNLGMKRQPDHRTEIILSIEHPGLWCFRKPSSILGAGPVSTPRLTESLVITTPCDTGTRNQAQDVQALPQSPCTLGSGETRSNKSSAAT